MTDEEFDNMDESELMESLFESDKQIGGFKMINSIIEWANKRPIGITDSELNMWWNGTCKLHKERVCEECNIIQKRKVVEAEEHNRKIRNARYQVKNIEARWALEILTGNIIPLEE